MLHGLIRRCPGKGKWFLTKKSSSRHSDDLRAFSARVPQPQTVENLPRRVRAIKRVKMNPANFVLEKIVTLLGGVVNAHARDAFRIVLAALQSAEKPCREACACSQFGHAFHPADRGDRHDSRHDRDVNADKLTTITKIKEVAIVEEKLGDNVVRSRIDLLFQIIHLQQPIGCSWMSFRKSRNANSESAPVGMVSRFTELSNEFDEINRVLEVIIRLSIRGAFWGIATEGKNIADACLRVAFENSGDLRLVVAHTREMRNRVQRGRPLDPDDKIMGHLSCRAPRTVSDADEVRLVGLQLPNGSIETFHRLGTLWGEKLKRKRRSRGSENVLSVHSKATERINHKMAIVPEGSQVRLLNENAQPQRTLRHRGLRKKSY
jgi:hypothetical protein